jgi:Fibronectin type III domain
MKRLLRSGDDASHMIRNRLRAPTLTLLVLIGLLLVVVYGAGIPWVATPAPSASGDSGLTDDLIATPIVDGSAQKSCSSVTSCASPTVTMSKPGDSIFVVISLNTSGITISAVDDNYGSALTLLTSATSSTSGSPNLELFVYKEYNWPHGAVAGEIWVNMSASASYTFVWAAIYATPASPIDATGSAANGHGTALTASVTTVSANDLILMAVSVSATGALTASGGSTLVKQQNTNPSAGLMSQTDTSTGSFSIAATGGTLRNWVAIAIALLPGTGPSAPTGVTQTGSTYGAITMSWVNPPGAIVNSTAYRYSAAGCTGTQFSAGVSGNATTTTTVGIPIGTARYYEIDSWNATGEGTRSACTQGDTIPGPVTAASAAPASATSITVTWTNPTTAPTSGVLTNEYVYWQAGASCAAATQIVVGSVTTTYTKTGLTTGTQYCFYVEAVDNGGVGNASATVTAVTSQVPGAPTGLAMTSVGTTSIHTSWSAPSGGGILNYTMYWGTVLGTYTSSASVGTGTTYTIGSLTRAVTYYFVVSAWNATGQSPQSTHASATTLPGNPMGVTVGVVTATSVALTWTQGAGQTIVNDTIFAYKNVGGVCGSVTYFSAGNATSGTATSLSGATAYCFAVMAFSAGGGSTLQTIFTNTTTLPAAPTALSATSSTTTTISWGWSNPSGTLTDDYLYWQAGTSCAAATKIDIGSVVTTYTLNPPLSSATEYCAYVEAVSAGGASAASSTATGWTIPTTATSLVVNSVTTTTIVLGWSNPSGTLVNDTIYRWTGAACSSALTTTSLGSALTSDTQTGLAGGTHYWFEVQAWSAGGGSALSLCVEGTTLNSVPGAPTGLAAQVSYTAIEWTWTNPAGSLVNVTIYLGCGPTGTALGASATTETQTGLVQGTTYCAAVNAWTSGGGGASIFLNATTLRASSPGQVTGLAVQWANSNSVALSWASMATATNYTVWGGVSCGTWLMSYPSAGPSTIIPGLTTGVTYCFSVQAWHYQTGGQLSTSVVVTTALGTSGTGSGGGGTAHGGAQGNNTTTILNQVAVAPLLIILSGVAIMGGLALMFFWLRYSRRYAP